MRTAPSSSSDGHRTIRIISVIAATCIALSCGTNYAYSAWGPQFASRLQLSATQANLIGNAGNIGMYAMGIPGGILIDSRGPRWGVIAGCISLACGYFPLRSAYISGPGSMGMPALCFFGLLTGMGSCTAFSASLKVCATNWPKHRGTATAFPLSAFGLSAFFYTAVASVLFPHDTAGYLGLLAGGTTAMVFLGMFFLQIIRQNSPYEAVPTDERPGVARRDSNRMRRTSTPTNKRNDDDDEIVEQGEQACLSSNSPRPVLSYGATGMASETSSLVSSPNTSLPGDIVDDPKPQGADGQHKSDITGFALLRSVKFYQLWILLALLCGTGLMTINNIGNNARSLWHHWDDSASLEFIQKRQLMHVSILSLASFAGRLGSGIGSDWLIHHHASRFWTLVVSACLFTIAQMVALGLEDPNHLYWLSGLTGLAYGALFGVYPALVADAFGPSGMGINWGAMTMAPVLSGNVFNLAYGTILDHHSHYEDREGSPERVCDEGRACYSSAYWITLLASVIAVGWSLWCIRQDKLQRMRELRDGKHRAHEG